MKRMFLAFSTAVLVIVLGCVVIPDTFEAKISIDIRYIQEQADKVLDYVEGKTDTLPGVAPAPANANQSSLMQRAVDFLSPIRVAYAQELKDVSPRAKQIADKMRERFGEVDALKKTGAVGENNRGYLELVKPELLADDAARNAAQRTIAADNEDRKALYNEIARLNADQNVKVGTVERIYAQRRLERAQAGELFQLPPPGEEFESFKKSAAGQKLGAACVPDSWVTIP